MDRVRYHLGLDSPRFRDRIPVCQMRRKLLHCGVRSKKNPVITASERRSLDGDNHVSKCRNENVALVGKRHCGKRALTAVEDRNMKYNEKK